MTRDHVEKYYIDGGDNCAESLLRSINDEYDLGIDPESFKLIGGFGGGLGCGITCGALDAPIAALGKMAIKGKAHKTPGFKELCADFVAKFRESEGYIDCQDLKPINSDPEKRCLKTVLKAADTFDAFVQEHGLV